VDHGALIDEQPAMRDRYRIGPDLEGRPRT
jgi:hypothetical protein